MMYPTLEKLKELASAGTYRRIPVCRELLADRFTPVEVMRTLRAASRHCFLLESAENTEKWGRYTFLGYSPTLELTCKDHLLRIRYSGNAEIAEDENGNGGKNMTAEHVLTGDEEFEKEYVKEVSHPGDAIRQILKNYTSPKLPGMPPFTGGLVGYFSYDYIKYAEPSLDFSGLTGENFCDVDLMLFDKVIAFDHYRQKLILITGVDPGRAEDSYGEAKQELNEIEQLLNSGAKAVFKPLKFLEELAPLFPEQDYCGMVEKARNYIHEGDIFQVVLSDPLTAKAEGSLFDTYRVLRTVNPSPYMFYFTSDDVEIAGASPETLAKLEDGQLYSFPLAGTRPRGKTPEEDAALEQELLADEKELAEHNMLVDLGRNDLGRISRLGTVKVEKYCSIERFSHVMHIGSTVTGRIREDRDAVDAIDSILPAGTLSGAPKLRACEIIGELEGVRRGIYGGAVGYLDFTGNLDTCIAIRLAYKKNGTVCVRSGAGIVADSVPKKEFEECTNKAKAVVNALKQAEGGLS